jgi:hypothetical protein
MELFTDALHWCSSLVFFDGALRLYSSLVLFTVFFTGISHRCSSLVPIMELFGGALQRRPVSAFDGTLHGCFPLVLFDGTLHG